MYGLLEFIRYMVVYRCMCVSMHARLGACVCVCFASRVLARVLVPGCSQSYETSWDFSSNDNTLTGVYICNERL